MQTVLLSAVVSFVVAVGVSYLSPWFTHFVWKKQKRKEQQLAIAERFAKLGTNVHVLRITPDMESNFEEWKDASAAMLEQEALLTLIFVVFEWKEVKERAAAVATAVANDRKAPSARAELQALLFAEALDIPANRVPARLG